MSGLVCKEIPLGLSPHVIKNSCAITVLKTLTPRDRLVCSGASYANSGFTPPLWILSGPPWHIDAVGGRSDHHSGSMGQTCFSK